MIHVNACENKNMCKSPNRTRGTKNSARQNKEKDWKDQTHNKPWLIEIKFSAKNKSTTMKHVQTVFLRKQKLQFAQNDMSNKQKMRRRKTQIEKIKK